MRRTIKPSKGMSKMQFVIGIFFCFFGLGFLMNAIKMQILPMILFSIVWLAIVAFNMMVSFKNGFTNQGMGLYDIDDAEDFDYEEKLRSLERLRMESLISEEEYQDKRAEVLKKEW